MSAGRYTLDKAISIDGAVNLRKRHLRLQPCDLTDIVADSDLYAQPPLPERRFR